MTPLVRPLVRADLPEVDALLAAAFGRREDWGDELWRLRAVQPDGWYVAIVNESVVGVGGATDYGPFAWIGLMGVDPGAQRQRIGRAVLERILARIREKGCPTAVLDASAAGERLYERFGFLDHGTTVLYRRDVGASTPPPVGTTSEIQVSDLPSIAEFDCRYFGADRSDVLRGLFRETVERGIVARDGLGRLEGYLFVQHDRIGPWVAETPEIAETLLSSALRTPDSGPLTARVPSMNSTAEALVQRYGFTSLRSLRHMYLGPSPPGQELHSIYSEASFASG